MFEADPERKIPPEEYAFTVVDEEFLLLDPLTNAGALYDLYDARAHIIAERINQGSGSLIDTLTDTIGRMERVSKTLPDDDPRSYAAWKKRFQEQQQRI